MMFLKLIGLLVIGTIIKSEAYKESDKYVDYHAHPKYTFSYGVEDFKTGDYKMHKEERDGDVVKGEYKVADPNGSIRTVTYTADKEHGFQAVVKQSLPIEAPHAMKENQEDVAEHKQNEESSGSSQYNYYHDGLSTQSNPVFKYSSPVNTDKYLHRFTDDSHKIQKQEIKKINNKATAQFKYNQQHEFEAPKTQYLSTGMNKANAKQIEATKHYPQIKESSFQFVPKVNAAKSENAKVSQQFKFEYPALSYNPTEQLYYGSEHVENPKTESSYFPVQTNYGYNFKQKADVKPSNTDELKQSVPQLFYPNYGYDETAKDDYSYLYNQAQNGKIQKPDVSKKVEEHKPAYSYQSVVNGKSQVKSKGGQDTKTVQKYGTSTEKQSEPQLYSTQQKQVESVSKKEEQKPAVSYQTVINRHKSRLGNKQGNVKYYKVNQGPEFSFDHEAEKQQVYTPQIYNIDLQQYGASPHQSVANGKSQEKSKNIKQQFYYTQQQQQPKEDSKKEEQKPAFSYQTVINGQKYKLDNKQQTPKYYQQSENNNGPKTAAMKQAQKQQLFAPHIYNIQPQENAKTETKESPQSDVAQYYANLQKQFQNIKIPTASMKESPKQVLNTDFPEEYFKPQYQFYQMQNENHQPIDLQMYKLPEAQTFSQSQDYPTFPIQFNGKYLQI